MNEFSARGSVVLCFGLLEAVTNSTIEAETLILDPQGGSLERALDGAQWDRLAIVANERESAALTHTRSLDDAGRALLRSVSADVVVIKCGARGALVFTSEGEARIGPFPTN